MLEGSVGYNMCCDQRKRRDDRAHCLRSSHVSHLLHCYARLARQPRRLGVEKQKRQRRQVKLPATPEEVARAMFAAVPPPDPSRRRDTSSEPRNTA